MASSDYEQLRAATVERFSKACRSHVLVDAAFLGGSLASGTADRFSDLDIYVITSVENYERFFDDREGFMRSWCEPVFLDTTRDFEGLGFHMLHFVAADGVWGEVALGNHENLMAIHGGAYRTLVDKSGVLDGVEFALYEQPHEEVAAEVARALGWFWVDLLSFKRALGRGHLLAAATSIESMRRRCGTLLAAVADVAAEPREPNRLLATFTPAEPEALLKAVADLTSLHREVGRVAAERYGVNYPHPLARVLDPPA